MTPEQMRAARALLDISQGDVAEAIDITTKTLSNAESGRTVISGVNYDKLKLFYEQKGLEFTDFNGVRQKPSGNIILKGTSGFREFYDLLYQTAKTVGGDIILYNGVSELVVNALGAEAVAEQKARMQKIKNNYQYRVIVEEGDSTFFGADYCEYKWLPKKHFNDSTLFVFGSYFSVVDFSNDVEILIIDNQKVADSQKLFFEQVWDNVAVEPDE